MGDVDVKWKEINRIIHNVKYTLGAINKTEKLFKTIRQELIEELDELYKIINEQPMRQIKQEDKET